MKLLQNDKAFVGSAGWFRTKLPQIKFRLPDDLPSHCFWTEKKNPPQLGSRRRAERLEHRCALADGLYNRRLEREMDHGRKPAPPSPAKLVIRRATSDAVEEKGQWT